MAGFEDAVNEFLSDAAVTREDVDRFLDPDVPKWAEFDPELGYIPHTSQVRDGADGAISTYTYGLHGERRTINYPDHECRINSYGDSFTQCHQVSDGETWQEHIAANIGEPIRNFGVGGFGVYQAYLRLRRVEATDAAAAHVIFNIFLDDHSRNLDAYRLLRVGSDWWQRNRTSSTSMFHANPWRHVRFDTSGRLVERPNPCPSEDSLYGLCDRDFLIDTFGDDFVVHLLVARRIGNYEFLDRHEAVAAALGLEVDTSTAASGARSAEALYDRAAFLASAELLSRMRTELSAQHKKLLVLLSYPPETVGAACSGHPRPDLEFLRQLDNLGIDYIDSLAAHVADYATFSITPEEYVDRYYYGHYTPAGNHFFGAVTKPSLVTWLDPPPPAYGTNAAEIEAGRLA